jgi:hypothetical protein
MQTFTCLLSDTRYSVPSLVFVIATDVERAKELARRELEANAHHRGFELHDDQHLVCAEQR